MVENTASFKLLQDGYDGVALTKMFPAKGFYPSTSSGGGAWYAAKLLDEQQRVGKESRETVNYLSFLTIHSMVFKTPLQFWFLFGLHVFIIVFLVSMSVQYFL